MTTPQLTNELLTLIRAATQLAKSLTVLADYCTAQLKAEAEEPNDG